MMNDVTNPEVPPGSPFSADNYSGNATGQTPSEVPRFGAVDIVEAFTAMRHECRLQTRETRTLAEQVQVAVSNVQSLESKLLGAIKRSDELSDVRRLVQVVVETDHQLSRAVAAITHSEETRRMREAAEAQAVEHCITTMNAVARWFARPLLMLLAGQQSTRGPCMEGPALVGLNMVLTRHRRLMHEHDIHRLDVLGQPFDASTMHAIGTVASHEYPPGHVAEQLSPAYRWQGQLIRFADVRVAGS